MMIKHPAAMYSLFNAWDMASECLSQEFGEKLFQATSSPSTQCPAVPHQEALSLALKVVKLCQLIAPLFSEDPTASNIEKTLGTELKASNAFLRQVAYDLKQPDSYIRNSLTLDPARTLNTFGDGIEDLVKGFRTLRNGFSQVATEAKHVARSFSRAMNRQIPASESASVSASTSSSESAASSISSTSSSETAAPLSESVATSSSESAVSSISSTSSSETAAPAPKRRLDAKRSAELPTKRSRHKK
jgi:hypothetical protein